ncbi:hypothetical protein QTP70_018733, partial [Hemibagrus guttatus]
GCPYCMRKSGVAEKYVRVVQDMYERSRTVVRCAVGQTEEFKVEVGLHQGSALSPFLFAMVMDQLSEEVRQESHWTMMFADDLVFCSESREQVEEYLERWRFALVRRGMKVSHSNENLNSEEEKTLAASNHLSELRLVLLGWRWPGKSLTGNTILGREEFRLERAAEFSVKRDAERNGRKLTVVDTPGWFSAQTTPTAYQQEMARSLGMCPPGPHAILLVVPVGMFTEMDRARIEENFVLFGEAVWRHTMVVFTWAEVLKNMPIERHIHRQGSALQWVLDKCKKRYHVINNDAFGEQTQVPQLIEKVEKMVAEEGGHFRPMTEEEKVQNQDTAEAIDENSNPKAMKEKRELGARPKQNCSFSSVRPVDAESTHNLMEEVSD